MDTGKIKVMIVEDEASIRRFIAINLNRSGFGVPEVGEDSFKGGRNCCNGGVGNRPLCRGLGKQLARGGRV